MARSEIHLDGAEVSIIKALGFGSSDVNGEDLMSRASDLEEAELIDAIKGLITMGYIVADRNSFYDKEGLAGTQFHINSGYSRDLKDALDPRAGSDKPKSKRVRRE